MKQVLGVLILLVVFAAIFVATVHVLGWQTALGTWAIAIGLASLITLGVILIVDGTQ